MEIGKEKKIIRIIPKVKLLPLGEWQKRKAEVVPVKGPSTTSPETASDHPHCPLTMYPHWLKNFKCYSMPC